jgi:hypothetical protein
MMICWLGKGLPRQLMVMKPKQPVLDLVPLAGRRREAADPDAQSGVVDQPLRLDLPQLGAAAVGPAVVAVIVTVVAERNARRRGAPTRNGFEAAVSWSTPTLTQPLEQDDAAGPRAAAGSGAAPAVCLTRRGRCAGDRAQPTLRGPKESEMARKERGMAPYTKSEDKPVLNRSLLWSGAVLIGIGALLGLAGSAACGAAAVLGLQRHVKSSGMPPSELAMHHWRGAKTAAQSGANAWRGEVLLPLQRQAPVSTRVG